MEGLKDSRRPCAGTLSVAGFFALRERFPLEKGFIPEVKEASFLRREARLFDTPGITVVFTHCLVYIQPCTPSTVQRAPLYRRGLPTWVYGREGI